MNCKFNFDQNNRNKIQKVFEGLKKNDLAEDFFVENQNINKQNVHVPISKQSSKIMDSFQDFGDDQQKNIDIESEFQKLNLG